MLLKFSALGVLLVLSLEFVPACGSQSPGFDGVDDSDADIIKKSTTRRHITTTKHVSSGANVEDNQAYYKNVLKNGETPKGLGSLSMTDASLNYNTLLEGEKARLLKKAAELNSRQDELKKQIEENARSTEEQKRLKGLSEEALRTAEEVRKKILDSLARVNSKITTSTKEEITSTIDDAEKQIPDLEAELERILQTDFKKKDLIGAFERGTMPQSVEEQLISDILQARCSSIGDVEDALEKQINKMQEQDEAFDKKILDGEGKKLDLKNKLAGFQAKREGVKAELSGEEVNMRERRNSRFDNEKEGEKWEALHGGLLSETSNKFKDFNADASEEAVENMKNNLPKHLLDEANIRANEIKEKKEKRRKKMIEDQATTVEENNIIIEDTEAEITRLEAFLKQAGSQRANHADYVRSEEEMDRLEAELNKLRETKNKLQEERNVILEQFDMIRIKLATRSDLSDIEKADLKDEQKRLHGEFQAKNLDYQAANTALKLMMVELGLDDPVGKFLGNTNKAGKKMNRKKKQRKNRRLRGGKKAGRKLRRVKRK